MVIRIERVCLVVYVLIVLFLFDLKHCLRVHNIILITFYYDFYYHFLTTDSVKSRNILTVYT